MRIGDNVVFKNDFLLYRWLSKDDNFCSWYL